MNVVDSSGWLEYFADGSNAVVFAPVIEKTKDLIVPTLCITEVFKKVLKEQGENMALEAIALMQQGKVVDLTLPIAINAAKIGYELKIPLADSIVYATAQHYQAILWTQDCDFHGLKNVKYIQKKKE